MFNVVVLIWHWHTISPATQCCCRLRDVPDAASDTTCAVHRQQYKVARSSQHASSIVDLRPSPSAIQAPHITLCCDDLRAHRGCLWGVGTGLADSTCCRYLAQPVTDTIILPALISVSSLAGSTADTNAAIISAYMGAVGVCNLFWGPLSDRLAVGLLHNTDGGVDRATHTHTHLTHHHHHYTTTPSRQLRPPPAASAHPRGLPRHHRRVHLRADGCGADRASSRAGCRDGSDRVRDAGALFAVAVRPGAP